jgi:hypothetical protein
MHRTPLIDVKPGTMFKLNLFGKWYRMERVEIVDHRKQPYIKYCNEFVENVYVVHAKSTNSEFRGVFRDEACASRIERKEYPVKCWVRGPAKPKRKVNALYEVSHED